jgi:hypothetical protein
MGLGSVKGLAVGDWSRVVQGGNQSFGTSGLTPWTKVVKYSDEHTLGLERQRQRSLGASGLCKSKKH